MGNTIKGNVGELFVLSTGEIKEPKNLDKFHPQSNVNILVINIEGIPQEKTMAQINFAPTNKSGWASVWFPLNRKGVLHHKLENEDEYRTFTQYTIQVPEPITTLNLNNSSALNVGITFRHIGGIDFLGAYETIQDLIAEYPPYQDLSEMLAIAYVYGTTNYGFYQVVFDNGVYVWQQTPSPIAQLQIKPYNMGNIQIQGGYGTRTPIQSIADSQYNLIWLELNTIASRLDYFYDKEHIDNAFLEKYTTPTGDNDVFSIYGITAQGQQAIYQASVENYDNTIVVRDGVGRIKDLDKHNISSEAHSGEFSKKVDKITEEQRDSLGFMEHGDRIVYAVDGNLNEMPIRATGLKRGNTIVMRGSDGTFQDLYDHNTMVGAHTYEFSKKVDKTQTIIGIDLQDNILLGEFKEALGEATQSVAGLLSAEDKTHLDALVALLETNDSNNVVDTIGEILAIFQNYPEGAELVTVLQGKVDKVVGKGLSTNDFTDEYKNKVDDTIDDVSQLQEDKQDKLTAGDSITIDENNVIEVDLNAMSYFDYAGRIYGDKYSLLKNAWEHSLTVDPLEILLHSSYGNYRGTAQYPNGETEGVIIPQGVTSIGAYAFYDWSSNNKPLVIPNSVTSVGFAAFSGWSSNNQPLVIPNSVTSIGAGAFYGWSSNNQPLVIPDSVISIGGNAFQNWLSVPYVEMKGTTPPTLSNSNAFGDQNDAPIYVPDESVDDYKEATNWVDLADRIFPISDKLVSGGEEVDLNEMAYFDYAGRIYGDKYSLLKNAWEHSLTVDPLEISEDSDYSSPRGKAQYPNGETEGVIIPQGVTSIGSYAFCNWSANNQPLVIPNSVTSIGERAFSGWWSNKQPLVIPNSVTSIGERAFSGWWSNKQPLIIPNSVTSIGVGAFFDWIPNNHPLVIPDSVTNIREYAFYGWSSVPYVEMKATTPPTLEDANAFQGFIAPIYVPDESVEAYKAATNWVSLADRIFPISDRLTPSDKGFHRVRIFNENGNLIQTQVVYDGEKISRIELAPDKFLFEYGTENVFSYPTKVYEDTDLIIGDIPARYVQTTTADFNAEGDYTGTESYIILPADKPSGYQIVNPNVIGVATNGNYLTNCYGMFRDNPSLYLELDYLDTSNVTNMAYMFHNSQATTLDLSSFDTSNVIYMHGMFYNSQATTLDLSSFNTSNVTNMKQMFHNSQATTLDLSSFDTSNVIYMHGMFYNSQATTLDLSSFDTSSVTSMSSMFSAAQATTGYARTQADADRFNDEAITLIPSTLTFVVK